MRNHRAPDDQSVRSASRRSGHDGLTNHGSAFQRLLGHGAIRVQDKSDRFMEILLAGDPPAEVAKKADGFLLCRLQRQYSKGRRRVAHEAAYIR